MFRRRRRTGVRFPFLLLVAIFALACASLALAPAAQSRADSVPADSLGSSMAVDAVRGGAAWVGSAASLPTESMPTSADIVIHKLAQPDEPGDPATGLEQDVPGTPIAGVKFTATQVPGIDLASPAAWAEAASLPVSEAIEATVDTAPTATTTTDAAGIGTLADLPIGLYLVRETATPAGVLPADPFLVTAPMPHQGHWLTAIHVYPKNAIASISLAVEDSRAIDASNPVSWNSSSTIPMVDRLTQYVVTNTLDPALSLIGGASGVRVQAPWGTATADEAQVQVVTLSGAACAPSARATTGGTTCTAIEVEFTAAGLAKLGRARQPDPTASVQVSYQTTVNTEVNASGNGVFRNHVALATGNAAGETTTPVASQVTKFGPLALQARDRDNQAVVVPGVKFQIFASEEDARNRVNPLTIWGQSEWITDASGQILLDGLRFSDFANGFDQPAGSALYRPYFVVVVGAPSGWTYASHPQAVLVDSSQTPVVLVAELWKSGGPGGPGGGNGEQPGPGGGAGGSGAGGGLAVTGASVAGAAILGFALVLIGIIVVCRREAAEDEG